MNDRDPMKALGELAREQARQPVAAELARPFDDAELDRLTAGVAAALPARRARVLKWRAPVVGAVLAAAAAVLFLVRAPAPATGVAAYDLTIEGAARDERGGADAPPTEPLHVDRAGHLVVVARPRAPAPSAEAQTWIESPPGAFRRWDLRARRSDEGALRFDAAAADLATLPVGRGRLVVLVGAGPLPGDPAAAARAASGNAPGVQVLSRELDVR